ncbi:MAG: hypothetical protein IKI11_08715 [Neisseriaceae bacterium]|nr:hypothetical protein [Neisseriaceae bacterium]
MILNKIPPYRAVGGLTRPPYNDCICFMLKIGFAKVSGCLKNKIEALSQYIRQTVGLTK